MTSEITIGPYDHVLSEEFQRLADDLDREAVRTASMEEMRLRAIQKARHYQDRIIAEALNG